MQITTLLSWIPATGDDFPLQAWCAALAAHPDLQAVATIPVVAKRGAAPVDTPAPRGTAQGTVAGTPVRILPDPTGWCATLVIDGRPEEAAIQALAALAESFGAISAVSVQVRGAYPPATAGFVPWWAPAPNRRVLGETGCNVFASHHTLALFDASAPWEQAPETGDFSQPVLTPSGRAVWLYIVQDGDLRVWVEVARASVPPDVHDAASVDVVPIDLQSGSVGLAGLIDEWDAPSGRFRIGTGPHVLFWLGYELGANRWLGRPPLDGVDDPDELDELDDDVYRYPGFERYRAVLVPGTPQSLGVTPGRLRGFTRG